ncbi:MAG: HEAT repeat domain-containing protein, partial [Thermodesulfobacteriota bacterium]|nr:HEAT repeat domain-containing protein [Thermodesulfobacteriota bacterium]
FLIVISLFLMSCQADPINDLKSDNPVIWAQAADTLSKNRDPRVLEPLIDALKNENRHVRKKAAEALGNMGDPRGTEPLISALNDEYWEVRKKSVEALGKIKDEKAIGPLISSLNDGDCDVRFRAVRALENMGKPATGSLVLALKDRESTVRKGAADTLNKIGWRPANTDETIMLLQAEQRWDELASMGVSAVKPLVGSLEDKDGDVRKGAAGALENIGNPAIEPLIKVLESRDGVVRAGAADILNKLGWKPSNTKERVILLLANQMWDDIVKIGTPATTYLTITLKDKDSKIRKNTSETLTKIGWRPSKEGEKSYFLLANQNWDDLVKMGSPGTDLLIIALKDKEDDIRKKALQALGKTGDPRGVPSIVAALKDENPDIRFESAAALKRIGNEGAVKPLINALEDESAEVREIAADALMAIGSPAVESLINALAEGRKSSRRLAAHALGTIGDARSIEPLIAALKDEDWKVVKGSALSLGKIGVKSALEPLVALLEEKDPNIREGAAEALGTIGDKRAVPPLIDALADESSFVRRKAADSLGALGDESSIESLNNALKDNNGDVRKEAAKALAKMDWEPPVADQDDRITYLVSNERWDEVIKMGTPAVSQLIDALNDEDENIRSKSAWTLGKINDPEAIEALIKALKDDDTEVRTEASLALENMGPLSVHPLVATLEDETLRKTSIIILGKIGDKRAVAPIVKKLNDWYLNVEVAETLSALGWTPASESERVHWWVATRNSKSLGEHWNTTKDILLKEIENPDYVAVENALSAFDFMGKEEIVPLLIEKLNSKGTETMAEAYLNCGNPEIEEAARNWAEKRGYKIK